MKTAPEILAHINELLTEMERITDEANVGQCRAAMQRINALNWVLGQ